MIFMHPCESILMIMTVYLVRPPYVRTNDNAVTLHVQASRSVINNDTNPSPSRLGREPMMYRHLVSGCPLL